MKTNKLFLAGFVTIITLLLTGCKSKKEDETVFPATDLYQNGLTKLGQHKYSDAAKEFGKVFFQHPGNDITPQAELMQAYSLYLDNQYDEAIDVLETFTKLHPMNVDIAYAYYLRALCHYMQISDVHLDQSRTTFAKESFEEVIGRFPGSKYAIDSALKIDLVNDHLAGKEMEIGRYYLHKKNPIAAINRFQNVIDNYQTTSHTPEALYRLVESYTLLGLKSEAQKTAAVLGHNYHDSKWYKYAYNLVEKNR